MSLITETPQCKMCLIQALENNAASWQKTNDNDKWIEPGSHSSQQHWLEKSGLTLSLGVPPVSSAPLRTHLPGVMQHPSAFPLTFFSPKREEKMEHVVVLPEAWQTEERQHLRDIPSLLLVGFGQGWGGRPRETQSYRSDGSLQLSALNKPPMTGVRGHAWVVYSC